MFEGLGPISGNCTTPYHSWGHELSLPEINQRQPQFDLTVLQQMREL